MTSDSVSRTNIPELTVSELAGGIQRTLENAFGRVRVRGEISGLKLASSGHIYADLKDENACMAIICWRTTAARLKIKPEDGMDVICTGKITTYPKSSRYQLIVESIELAGAGALLKMLEDRRKKLAAEGVFDADRKKPIPFLPDVIGVVTSPTGAVIRDILHRLEDRFPRRVLVWPVAVQGPGAAEQIAAAIAGFNALPSHGPVPRPDVLIVARGGGSLEDMMAFNDEGVVRAVAAGSIPLISAVGHETDTTLIDYVSDLRAPTPTGAAEMAVPVRQGLILQVMEDGQRLYSAMTRSFAYLGQHIKTAAARLGDPRKIIGMQTQTLDHLSHKMESGLDKALTRQRNALAQAAGRLSDPRHLLERKAQTLSHETHRLENGFQHFLLHKGNALRESTSRLPHPRQRLERAQEVLSGPRGRLQAIVPRLFSGQEQAFKNAGSLLEAYSYHKTLKRGFAVVRAADGGVVTQAGHLKIGQDVTLTFEDGQKGAKIQQEADFCG